MLSLKERGDVKAADLVADLVVTEYSSMASSATVTGVRKWRLAALDVQWCAEHDICRCTFVRGQENSLVASNTEETPRIPSVSGAICDVKISVSYDRAEAIVYPDCRTDRGDTWTQQPVLLEKARGARDVNRIANMIIVGRADLGRTKKRIKEKRRNPTIENCVSTSIVGERPAIDLETCTAEEKACARGEAVFKRPPADYVIRDLVVNVDADRLEQAHTKAVYEEKLATPINIRNRSRLESALAGAARTGHVRSAPTRRAV